MRRNILCLLCLLLFSGCFFPMMGQVAAPPLYSHRELQIRTQYCLSYGLQDMTFQMGKDRYLAGSITSGNSASDESNFVFDPNGLTVLTYRPSTGNSYNVSEQFSCIDANRIVWYACNRQDTLHFTRMTEQGAILSQFRLPGYGIAEMFADTLGKVFCFLKSGSGCGMARFSSNGTVDFLRWTNATLTLGGRNLVKYEADGRFYLKTLGNWLVMDRNGNTLKLLSPPAGYNLTAVYPDHGIAATKAVGGWLRVVRMDSNLVPVWRRAMRVPNTLNGADSLVQAVDGMVVPHTKELVLACEARDSISFNSPCWPPHSWNMRVMVIGDDGICRQKRWLPTYYANERLRDLSTSPYGQPLLTTFDNSCFGPAYHDVAAQCRALSLVELSPECFANYRIQVEPNYNTFTVGAGSLGALPTFTTLVVNPITDIFPLTFGGCYSYRYSATCLKPCANLYAVQPLGAGSVQFQDSIYGYHSLQYSFGDGTFGSSADPLHTYPGNGNFLVTVIATNECGSDTAVWGTVHPCQAATINSPLSSCVGVPAVFSQLSSFPSNALEWLVNGVSLGTGNTFSYTPSAIGTYQIGLVYHDTPCHDTTFHTLTVGNVLPQPNFSMALTTGTTIGFTNTTVNGATYLWSFGDGGTSTQANPVHTYAGSGPYTVCLRATNACGTDSLCQVWTCPFPTALFTYNVTSSLFTGQFTGTGASSWIWNFGDGQSATGSSVSHTYLASGTYNVCLQAISPCVTDTFCQTITVIANNRSFWRRTYDYLGPSTPRGQAENINHQTLIVGGSSQGEFMLLVDSTGSVLWTRTLPTANYLLYGCEAMPNGNFVVVGGTTASGPSQMNGLWMMVDLAGNISNAHVNGSNNYDLYRGAKAQRYGGFVLTGTTGSSVFSAADGMYTKVDANLQPEWSRSSHEYAYAGFQATDSSYIMVQTDRTLTGQLKYVHLNTLGVAYEEHTVAIASTVATGTIVPELSALMDCNDDVFVAFTAPDYLAGWGATNVNLMGIGRVNINTWASTGQRYAYSTGSTTVPSYDVSVKGIVRLTGGDIRVVGSILHHTLPNNNPKRQQMVWQVGSFTNLSVSQWVHGASTTNDSYEAGSPTSTTSAIASGLEGTTLSLHKFFGNFDCRLGTATTVTRLPVYNFGPIAYNATLPYPTTAFGTHSLLTVAATPLPGAGLIPCSVNCTSPVTASFTSTVTGNVVNLNSTSTWATGLIWDIPGQTCLSGSPINVTLPCGTTVVRLRAYDNCSVDTASQTIVIPGGFSVSAGPNQVVCPGATATFTASPGYSSYLWSNGGTNSSITVSAPGTYTVTVGNGTGCTAINSVTLSNSIAPTIALNPNTTVCNGDTAILDVGPGFSSYLWSNGATTSSIQVTTPGPYNVTVTYGAGCTVSATTNLASVANPVVNLGPDDTLCAGTLFVVNAGLGFNNYAWSTGSTNSSIVASAAGTYAVTVTDANGCEGADTLILVQQPLPVVNLGANQTVCFGDSLLLNAGPGFSNYVWSSGSSNASIVASTPGTYAVTVTDANGCEGTDTVTLSFFPPNSIFLGLDTTIVSGNTLLLDAGPGFANYLWSNGATTASIVVTQTGTYWVQGTDANGCLTTDTIHVSVVTAVAAAIPLFFQVSPIPTFDFLRVRVAAPDITCLQFSLVDLTGKVLIHQTLTCERTMDFSLDVRSVAAGIYFLRLEGDYGMQVRKVEVLR